VSPRRLTAALLTLCALSAGAEQHINQIKGFNANGVYQVNDYDSINAFNGNLTISIPIGNAYPIAEGASLQLTLHSNANVWDAETYLGGDCGATPGSVAYAHRRANAGMGWILTLGRLYAPGDPTNDTGWAYESPDGAEHKFGGNAVEYTDDESHLRITTSTVGAEKAIEFPDGTKHYFKPDSVEPTLWILDRVTRLTEVSQEKLLYRVNYDEADVWKIIDAHNRTHRITFAAVKSFGTPIVPYDGDAEHRMVTSVSFADGSNYSFQYESAKIGRQRDIHTLDKLCPSMDLRTTVWFLKHVVRPDGTQFDFTYDQAFSGVGAVGLPVTMTLPTGGAVQWIWDRYGKPAVSATERYFQESWGVRKRYVHPRGSVSSTFWQYDTSFDDDANPTNERDIGRSTKYQRTTITDPVGKVTESYFDVDYDIRIGGNSHDYSRPYTKMFPALPGSPLLLSQRIFAADPATPSILQLRQSTYVEYEDDENPLAEGPPHGGRVKSQKVVRNDDGNHSTTTVSSDYDGLGHYRAVWVNDTAAGEIARTTFTNYKHGASGAALRSILPGERWITGLYDSVLSTETGPGGISTSTQMDVCINDATGLVRGTRVRRGGPLSNDLYTFYTYDDSGNRIEEKVAGGDAEPLSGSGGSPCDAPASVPYKIAYQYAFGVGRESKYEGVSFKSVDLDIEPATGRAIASRDAAGVRTTYEYDNMGRVTAMRPTGSAWTQYVYTSASPASPAAVTVYQWRASAAPILGSELTSARFYYDGFGRVIQQSRKMPETWSTVWTDYDVLGRKTLETTAQATFTGHFASRPTFAPSTRWAYDALGRTISVTQPDNKATLVTYIGSRQTRRTATVATSTTAEEAVSVLEEADGFGRLIKVTEDEGAGRANEITNYDYDVAGRLTAVRIQNASTPVRTFQYDGAGLLKSEVHPESGTTTYAAYDARGHVLTRSAPLPALTYEYDNAERLKAVKAGGLPFKEFVFDRPSSGSDFSMGKLDQATRYNRHSALPNGVQPVTEVYKYTGPGGAIFEKTTIIGSKVFADRYHYDDLGAVGSVDYPTCTGCPGLVAPTRSVSTVRTLGLTTSVDTYAKDIRYHPNGLLSQIRHLNGDGSNGPLYEQLQSTANNMSRPERIKVSGFCEDLNLSVNSAGPVPREWTGSPGTQVNVTITMPGGATSVQWYERTAAGEALIPGETGTTLGVTADVTRSYFARVKNDTCYADSAVSTINVATSCANPATVIAVPDVLIANVAATAAVSPSPGATYEWTLEGSGTIANVNSPTVSFTPGCGGTVKLKVKVTTACASQNGETSVFAVERAKASVSGSITMPNRDNNAILKLALSGLGPWTVTWNDGYIQTVPASTPVVTREALPPTGVSSFTFSVTSVTDATGCSGTSEGSATVTIATPSCTVGPDSDFQAWPVLSSQINTFAALSQPNASYSWTVTNAVRLTDSNPVPHRVSFRAGCSGVVTITLTATSTDPACGKSTTTTKSVPIEPARATVKPLISAPNIYVRGDAPFTIRFEALGLAPTVRWSDGVVQPQLQVSTAEPAAFTRKVQPTATTTYSINDVRDLNGCAGTFADSVTVVVCDPPVVDIQAPATMSADAAGTASVPATPGATYSWTISGGSIVSGATTSTVTFTPGTSCTQSVTLSVTVTTSCGVTRASSTTVPIIPTTASVTGSATIAQGNSTPVRATLTGVGPWTVRWTDQSVAEVVMTSTQTRMVGPMGTSTYAVATATDQRGCTAALSGQAVVTVVPPIPSMVAAKAVTSTQVAVTWSYQGNIDQFIVYRNGAALATISTPVTRSYTDIAVAAGQAYVYRVVAMKTGVASAPSAPDLATTVILSDDPLLTIQEIRAQHLLQLRTAVSVVRSAAGLSAATFTDASLAGKEMKAVHFNELRSALEEARILLGLASIGSERWPLQGGYEVWRTELMSLRAGVQ
jgi:YD repeat-containing protein